MISDIIYLTLSAWPWYSPPDYRKLYHPKTWYAAGVHVFSSLGLSLGSLILIGSYNTWTYDFVTDTFVSLGWDFFVNIVAAMTVFGAIGFLSHDHGLPVSFYARSMPWLGGRWMDSDLRAITGL
jgi:SNF family Na+-dependent transporter